MPEYPHRSCPMVWIGHLHVNCVALHGDPFHRYQLPHVGVTTPYEREASNA